MFSDNIYKFLSNKLKTANNSLKAATEKLTQRNEQLKEALEKAHANKEERGDRGGRKHGRMIGHILNKAGYPLDDTQKQQIKNIERDRGLRSTADLPGCVLSRRCHRQCMDAPGYRRIPETQNAVHQHS